MRIFEKLKEKLEIRKSNKLLEQAKGEYLSAETKQEGIDNAAQKAIEAIKAHPEEEAGAIGVLENLENSEMSKDVKVNTIIQIPTTSEIEDTDEIMKKAVEKLNLTSEDIQKILREAGDYISIKAAKEIIKQIPNPKIRNIEELKIKQLEKTRREQEKEKREKQKKQEENRIKQILRKRYTENEQIPISNLVDEINTIKSKSRSEEIQQMVRRVLARKAAISCKTLGNAPIGIITQVIPAEEMMHRFPTKLSEDEQKDVGETAEKDLNFIELTELEYQNIKDDERYKNTEGREYEFDKNLLEQMVLSLIAKNVVSTYNELGIIDIPQSETMKEISEEQEKFFIQQIQTYGKDITNISKIKNQIRGRQTREDGDWLDLIRKIPEDEKEYYLKELKNHIKRDKKQRRIELEPEVEEKLETIKERLNDLNVDDALQILKVAEEELKTVEKEREEEQSKNRKMGKRQSDDRERR